MVSEYRVGRGSADITGESAECGLLGYGKGDQQSAGIHTRLRARAFVVADAEQRVLLIVGDLPLIFDSIHREVLARLEASYDDLYTTHNVMLTATHTHCGPGGYSYHRLYNSNTHGFRTKTFEAIVDGILEAATAAHDDLAPADVSLAFGELHDASVNRSLPSFERNPAADRAHFPDAVDSQVTLMQVRRKKALVGAVTWFATHGTSMTNQNKLISGDNKGYAAYMWERLVAGVDYLEPTATDLVAAFPQTNTGDMSPNLYQAPGSGPTDNEFDNTRIIGTRQYKASSALLDTSAETLDGPIDTRITYVNFSDITVRPEFTGDGQTHRTSPPIGGAAALAGTEEGKGFPGFRQGRNPAWDALTRFTYYRISARLRDAQSPKAIVVPGSLLNRIVPMMPELAPVQLVRLGSLYLIGIPGEVTIVAGLRLRRTVAEIVGAPLRNVLTAGYSNGYIHYVTTPEEYDAQRYEGGSTMFGRWELPALQQVAASLAVAMRDGKPVDLGPVAPDVSAGQRVHSKTVVDKAPPGHAFGDVMTPPFARYEPGSQVRVQFAGGYPNHDLQRGHSYLKVLRDADGDWQPVAYDSDWTTKFRWKWSGQDCSLITATWEIPNDMEPGVFRIRYHGHTRDASGSLTPIETDSPSFEVTAR